MCGIVACLLCCCEHEAAAAAAAAASTAADATAGASSSHSTTAAATAASSEPAVMVNLEAADVLINGLKILQNRGYDSAGMATDDQKEGILRVSKFASRDSTSDSLSLLERHTAKHYGATIGVAHTRWSTHGGKTDENAHPHLDHWKSIALVHNGTITNSNELKAELLSRAPEIVFRSQTDTEVIAQWIGFFLNKMCRSLSDSVQLTLAKLEGTWGLAILQRGSRQLIVCRHGSPIVIGIREKRKCKKCEEKAKNDSHEKINAIDNNNNNNDNSVETTCSALTATTQHQELGPELVPEQRQASQSRSRYDYFVASEPCAFGLYTRAFISLEDDEVVHLTAAATELVLDRKRVQMAAAEVLELSPAPYRHWTEKEIMEQPDALRRVLNNGGRLPGGTRVKLGGLDSDAERLAKIHNLVIVGCGTSLYAAQMGCRLMEYVSAITTVQAVDAAELTLDKFPKRKPFAIKEEEEEEERETTATDNNNTTTGDDVRRSVDKTHEIHEMATIVGAGLSSMPLTEASFIPALPMSQPSSLPPSLPSSPLVIGGSFISSSDSLASSISSLDLSPVSSPGLSASPIPTSSLALTSSSATSSSSGSPSLTPKPATRRPSSSSSSSRRYGAGRSGAASSIVDYSGGVLFISQSGETKDTLRSFKLASDLNLPVLSIVNKVGSALARATGCGVYLNAGREQAVASTKAFTTQVMALALLAMWFAKTRGHPEGSEADKRCVALLKAVARQADVIGGSSDMAARMDPVTSIPGSPPLIARQQRHMRELARSLVVMPPDGKTVVAWCREDLVKSIATQTALTLQTELLKESVDSRLVNTDRLVDLIASETIRKIKEAVPEGATTMVTQGPRAQHSSIFVLGKGFAEPIAMEAALKIKEITYIHAEGYSGGALKHGPFALLSKGTPVILIILDDEEKAVMRVAAEEVRARGARTIIVTDRHSLAVGLTDSEMDIIEIGSNGPLTALSAIVPLQLLAYELAVLLGHNPDTPRNLAKAVTVD